MSIVNMSNLINLRFRHHCMNQVPSAEIHLVFFSIFTFFFLDKICRKLFFCFHLLLPFCISLFSSLENSSGGWLAG